MTRILLLPLDDRPCNRLFPLELGKIAGLQVVTPPRELLGRFTTPGQPEALAHWILTKAPAAKAAIVSVDMLCYGGLIASRTPAVSLEMAEKRLAVLRTLRERHPHLPLYAFSVIMRLSVTADSAEKVSIWRDVAFFSQLVDRVERLGETGLREGLDTVKKRIPAGILHSYLQARKRNHTINRQVVKMAGAGTLTAVVLCQEDAAPAGLHIPEQKELAALGHELCCPGQVVICAGTDEAALPALVQVASERWLWRPKVAVCYGSQEGAERTALFEDRPIAENVENHIAACGAARVESVKDADLALFVHTPAGPQQEAATSNASAAPEAHLAEKKALRQSAKRLVQRAVTLIEKGKPVAFADVAYCNGGDPVLIETLAEAGILHQLAGYAGWNTAGNSIGTALAQGLLWASTVGRHNPHGRLPLDGGGQGGGGESGVLLESSPPFGSAQGKPQSSATAGGGKGARALAEQVEFLFERLVDDFLYQSIVRQEANALAESLGASPLSLGRKKNQVERFIKRRLGELAEELFRENFAGRSIGDCRIVRLRRLAIRLPWPRTFEVEVKAEVEVAKSQEFGSYWLVPIA